MNCLKRNVCNIKFAKAGYKEQICICSKEVEKMAKLEK